MADSPSELQFEIEKLERRHAEHPEGRFFVPLANAYRKMGDLETAEALLRSGVERHPDYLSAHIVLGRCLADRGAGREAEEEFRFVLAEDPQNLIALRTLGELASADGRPAEAAEWYRELLSVDPMNEDARQALEALSDAPEAAEMETQFRSGAGWWESGSAEETSSPTPSGQEEQPPAASVSSSERAEDDPSQGEEVSAWGGYDPGPMLNPDSEQRTGREAPAGEWDAAEPAHGSVEDWPGMERLQDSQTEPPLASEPTGEADEQPYESFARREPDPFSAAHSADELGLEDAPEPGFSGSGSSEVVTETIAELYARQGLHERAADVYRELIRRRGGNSALEDRLAELERLSSEEAGGEAAPLTLRDDEAMQTPPMDVDEDPFAASFADGFTPVAEEPGSVGAHAGSSDEWAPSVADSGRRDDPFESPVPPLSHHPAAGNFRTDDSIVGFLSELARWRPGAAAAAPRRADQPAPGADSSPDSEMAVAEDVVDYEGLASDRAEAQPETEPAASGEATPALPGGGTVPAEDDEPFPWELPDASPRGESAAAAQGGPSEDPYSMDDVESPLRGGEESPPQAAAEPASGEQPQSGAASPAAEPSEDEDLESFQAWLRSLKR